jgi:hypothetical protein
MLTIREAADRTGHSTHKIRRLIKAIADQPNHPDRSQVEPNAADVQRLTAEGLQFTWRVTEELVRKELGDDAGTAETPRSEGSGAGDSNLVALLQRAIEAKEQAEARLFEQLRVKDEQIASLSERLRESHILLQSAQKQLAEPAKKSATTVESAKPAAANKQEKGRVPTTKRQRRSWFGRLLSGT